MRVIFVIAAYHHMLNLVQYVKYSGIYDDVVVLYPNYLSVSELGKLHSDLYNIRFVDYNNFTFSLKRCGSNREHVKNIIHDLNLNDDGFDVIYMQYLSLFNLTLFSMLKLKEYYLLDEGTASLKTSYERNAWFGYFMIFISTLKLAFLGLWINPMFAVTYITRFSLEIPKRDKIVHYRFSCNNLKKSVKKSKEIHWVGSSFVTLKLLDINDYIKLNDFVLNNCKNFRKIYFPHRKQSDEFVRIIENLGWEVRDLNEPYESFYNSSHIIPELVIGVEPSTVLYNLKESYGNEGISSFKVDYEDWRKSKSFMNYMVSALEGFNRRYYV